MQHLPLQTIRAGSKCPICESELAHHQNCPIRIEGPPGGDVLDHAGQVVLGELRPKPWSSWLPANGTFGTFAGICGPLPPPPRHFRAWSRWRLRGRLLVVSGLEWVLFNKAMCWQFHLSVSSLNGREVAERRTMDPDAIAKVLKDFGMENPEEDNHQPGMARNFWRSVLLREPSA